MPRIVKVALVSVAGLAGLGVLCLAMLVGLGFYLKSTGYVSPRRAAAQAAAAAAQQKQQQAAPAPSPSQPSAPMLARSSATAPAKGTPRVVNHVSEGEVASVVANGAPDAAAAQEDGGLIARLDAMSERGAHADVAETLFKGAAGFTPEEREEAAAWLEERQEWGRVPVLFLLARLHGAAGEMERAAEWFMAASLAYRIDAQCVEDATARQAVGVMEQILKEERSYILKTPGEVSRAIAWALEREGTLKDREPAYWIAAHGMGAFQKDAQGKPAAPKFAEGAEREKRRAEVRGAFEKMKAEAERGGGPGAAER